MGCFRLGFAIVFSLIFAIILTAVGAFAGAFIPLGHAVGETDTTGALIGGGIGAVIGLFVMVRMIKRAADINWLKKNGSRVIATVDEIKKKTGSRQVSYTVGGRTQYRTETYTYYVLTAHWTDPRTRQTHTFRRDNLNSYPRKYAQGSGISVLIDQQNPGRYFVEV